MFIFVSRITVKSQMNIRKNNKQQQNQQSWNNNQNSRFACLFSASHLRAHKRKDNF